MDTIQTNIKKPVEKKAVTKMAPTITRGIYRPASGFDRRPDVGDASYVGPSTIEKRDTGIKGGHGQSKKHKSAGKGQKGK